MLSSRPGGKALSVGRGLLTGEVGKGGRRVYSGNECINGNRMTIEIESRLEVRWVFVARCEVRNASIRGVYVKTVDGCGSGGSGGHHINLRSGTSCCFPFTFADTMGLYWVSEGQRRSGSNY